MITKKGFNSKETSNLSFAQNEESLSKRINFIDFINSHDRSLQMLAALLFQMNPNEVLDAKFAIEIGHQIDRYLETKAVVEHVFLNRSLPTSMRISDDELKDEIKRFRRLLS